MKSIVSVQTAAGTRACLEFHRTRDSGVYIKLVTRRWRVVPPQLNLLLNLRS